METKKCLICDTDKPVSEIVKRYEVKGQKVYICKECHEKIRELPDDYEMNHQF